MKKLFIIIASILLLLPVFGCTKSTEKVLLVFSYHAEFSWVAEEARGVDQILKDRGVETEKFYMDTKRNTGTDWKNSMAEAAVRKIDEFKPDLVIVFDDNACELVAKRYIGKSLPIVFCGMNGEPADYGFPAQNITGVIERTHIKATVNFLKRLVPGVEKLAIITDDNPTSRIFSTNIKKTILPVEISEFYATNDFDDWKAKVEELQTRVDAIYMFTYHTIKARGGEASLPSEDVLNWTLENNRLPDCGISDYIIRDGVLCGVTVSGYEQGRAAAEIAVRILNGEKPADIEIERPEKGTPMVNQARAKALNIEIPADVLKEAKLLP
ncbi:ABC transporter substrate-binding protein [Chloroflexota bacterium]